MYLNKYSDVQEKNVYLPILDSYGLRFSPNPT